MASGTALHVPCALAWSLREGMESWPLGAAQGVGGHKYQETWDQTILISKLLNSAGPQLPPLQGREKHAWPHHSNKTSNGMNGI